MILSLDIQNYILIEKAHIEFDEHFNVITGETGSGKSMFLSSVLVLLQSKLTDDIIRRDSTKLSISISFSLSSFSSAINELLSSYTEDSDAVVFERTKKIGSPSVCLINGVTVPHKIFKETISDAVYFSSQREQNMLLKSDSAVKILDSFASLDTLFKDVKDDENKLLKLKNKIDILKENIEKAEEEKDYLQSVKNEIESAKIEIGEDDKIKESLQKAKKSSLYINAIKESLAFLKNGDTNTLFYLSAAERELMHLNNKDADAFKEEIATLDNTYQTLSTLCEHLEDEFKSINLTEKEIDEFQERDVLLSRLKRKYGGTLQKVLEHLNSVNDKLSISENGNEELSKLSDEYNLLLKQYKEKKAKLYKSRINAATELDKNTQEHLHSLEMPSAIFKTEVKEGGDFKDDNVVFTFSANEGEKLGVLSEISSGGELSRLFLSLLSASPKFSSSHTIIFDEIDTGLGGNTARSLSLYLKELSLSSQVIAITHSALLAVNADCHIGVKKIEKDGRTYSSSSVLLGEDRIEEIARLLSGDKTSESLNLAKSMLSKNQ